MDESFEQTLTRIFKDKILSDDFAKRLWSSITNTAYRKSPPSPEGEVREKGKIDLFGTESFRSAGGLIADMRADGTDYMDWYCCSEPGKPDPEITEALKAEGWTIDEKYYDYVKLKT